MHDVEKEAVMPLFVTLNHKVVEPTIQVIR